MRDYEVRLSQEQLEELEDLSGAGYCIDKIAMYFDIPKKKMRTDFNMEDSWVRYHYDRGILLVDAKSGIELSKSASEGNITSIQQLAKLRNMQKLVELRKKIMYAKRLIDYNLDDLYKWIEAGQTSAAPQEFIQYVQLLEKIYRMMNRVDIYGSKEAIIKHLVTFEESIKGNRIRAVDLYNEAFEYFNADTKISKKAWRNFYANKLDQDYEMARAMAEKPDDWEKASRIIDRAGKLRQLDQEDPPELPRELFRKPIKVYTTDMDQFEIGNEDMADIEAWIDDNTKELSHAAIDKIKQEAMILPIKIFDDEETDGPN